VRFCCFWSTNKTAVACKSKAARRFSRVQLAMPFDRTDIAPLGVNITPFHAECPQLFLTLGVHKAHLNAPGFCQPDAWPQVTAATMARRPHKLSSSWRPATAFPRHVLSKAPSRPACLHGLLLLSLQRTAEHSRARRARSALWQRARALCCSQDYVACWVGESQG
jgi:hypothetical protein